MYDYIHIPRLSACAGILSTVTNNQRQHHQPTSRHHHHHHHHHPTSTSTKVSQYPVGSGLIFGVGSPSRSNLQPRMDLFGDSRMTAREANALLQSAFPAAYEWCLGINQWGGKKGPINYHYFFSFHSHEMRVSCRHAIEGQTEHCTHPNSDISSG